MKRLTLLTILLVVVGLTAGFAIDVKPTFSLSGSATVKWGVDLITMNHGFNNTADASFTLTLLPKDGTESKTAKDAWYGAISFANLEFYWTDAGVPVFGPADTDITAKIVGMGGNLEIAIYAKPSLKYEYAGFVPLFSEDAGYDTTGAVTPTTAVTGGLKISYTIAGIGTLSAKVASNGDWGLLPDVTAGDDTYTIYIADGTEDPVAALGDYLLPDGTVLAVGFVLLPNHLYLKLVGGSEPVTGSANDQYSFGADFSLTAVKDLTFAAGAFYNVETEYLGFAAKAGYTIAGASVNVGFDGQVVATVFDFDLAASVGYKFMKDKDSVSVNGYFDSFDRLDVGLLFTDAEGFVPGLAFTLGAYGNDLMGAQTMSFAESASYKFMMGDVNYVKPYEKFIYDLDTPAMYLSVGVEAMLIPNTVFKIDFTGGSTANDNNAGLVGLDIAAYQLLSISAKVSY